MLTSGYQCSLDCPQSWVFLGILSIFLCSYLKVSRLLKLAVGFIEEESITYTFTYFSHFSMNNPAILNFPASKSKTEIGHAYIYIYRHISLYIYTHRERERERQRGTLRFFLRIEIAPRNYLQVGIEIPSRE